MRANAMYCANALRQRSANEINLRKAPRHRRISLPTSRDFTRAQLVEAERDGLRMGIGR